MRVFYKFLNDVSTNIVALYVNTNNYIFYMKFGKKHIE
jgi:hypothetical protein